MAAFKQFFCFLHACSCAASIFATGHNRAVADGTMPHAHVVARRQQQLQQCANIIARIIIIIIIIIIVSRHNIARLPTLISRWHRLLSLFHYSPTTKMKPFSCSLFPCIFEWRSSLCCLLLLLLPP